MHSLPLQASPNRPRLPARPVRPAPAPSPARAARRASMSSPTESTITTRARRPKLPARSPARSSRLVRPAMRRSRSTAMRMSLPRRTKMVPMASGYTTQRLRLLATITRKPPESFLPSMLPARSSLPATDRAAIPTMKKAHSLRPSRSRFLRSRQAGSKMFRMQRIPSSRQLSPTAATRSSSRSLFSPAVRLRSTASSTSTRTRLRI